jgi:formylglycine-generating enzyme
MRFTRSIVLLVAAISAFLSATALGDVLRMPAGQTSLQFVTVGDPGNAGELSGAGAGGNGNSRICGAVNYTYQMGKFEVTAGQYTQFLNAVAKSDTYGLYSAVMADTSLYRYGCNIQRSGEQGSYAYSVAADWANRPVNLVSWGDAARFANWLTNGQPTGAQCAATTEDGSYVMNGAIGLDLESIRRKDNARYVIPSEDEWYKAAYYDPWGKWDGNYYRFATHDDVAPSNLDPSVVNSANYTGPTGRGMPIGSPYWRAEVGEFISQSYYGTYDQSGNVAEWTEEVMVGRVIRGGSFVSGAYAIASSERDRWAGWYEDGFTGFRIALVPEPSTMAVFLCGGLALLVRRSKR